MLRFPRNTLLLNPASIAESIAQVIGLDRQREAEVSNEAHAVVEGVVERENLTVLAAFHSLTGDFACITIGRGDTVHFCKVGGNRLRLTFDIYYITIQQILLRRICQLNVRPESRSTFNSNFVGIERFARVVQINIVDRQGVLCHLCAEVIGDKHALSLINGDTLSKRCFAANGKIAVL